MVLRKESFLAISKTIRHWEGVGALLCMLILRKTVRLGRLFCFVRAKLEARGSLGGWFRSLGANERWTGGGS